MTPPDEQDEIRKNTNNKWLKIGEIRKGCDWPECQCDYEGECEIEEEICPTSSSKTETIGNDSF